MAIMAVQPPPKDPDRIDRLIDRAVAVATVIVLLLFIYYLLREYVL